MSSHPGSARHALAPSMGRRNEEEDERSRFGARGLSWLPVAGGALRTYVLDVVEAERGAPPRVLQGLRGEGLVVAMDEAAEWEETAGRGLGVHGPGTARASLSPPCSPPAQTHLNWQKMSAYSAEMLEACSTVTRKVKVLPRRRQSSAASRGPSRAAFSGLPRARPSGGTAAGSQGHRHAVGPRAAVGRGPTACVG